MVPLMNTSPARSAAVPRLGNGALGRLLKQWRGRLGIRSSILRSRTGRRSGTSASLNPAARPPGSTELTVAQMPAEAVLANVPRLLRKGRHWLAIALTNKNGTSKLPMKRAVAVLGAPALRGEWATTAMLVTTNRMSRPLVEASIRASVPVPGFCL
jgi:hypothetical protein